MCTSVLYVTTSKQQSSLGSTIFQKAKFDYPFAKYTLMTELDNNNLLDLD